MKIKIEKVIKPLDLGDYLGAGDNAYRGKCLSVWVNPNAEVRQARQTLLMEYSTLLGPVKKERGLRGYFRRVVSERERLKQFADLREKNTAWLARLLDQDPKNPCPADDVKALMEADEVLYNWILARVMEMITAYQEEKKRSSKEPSKT